MKTFAKIRLLSLLAILLPLSILSAPQTTYAIPVIDAPLTVEQIQANILENSVSWVDVAKNTISSIADVSTEINTFALRIKQDYLDPLAFVLSGNALKAITAGVVDFVNGGNGKGPLFVRDLRASTLNTGDVAAFSFFAEFGSHSNSPFAGSILSALRTNYLQGTSAGGFWANNQCTLAQYSSNPRGFVGGNFAQGGWPAWFALTTQPQNNPYAQYYRAQAEYSARVRGATAEFLSQLSWGEGFLSWCGDAAPTSDTGSGQTSDAGNTDAGVDADGYPVVDQAALDAIDTTNVNHAEQNVVNNYELSNGRCPAGSKIETPASVIRDGLNKVLGTDLDKLVNVGDANTIFSNVASTLQVLAYGANLLGAANSGGLFGASHPLGGAPISMLNQYRNQQGYLGVTQTAVNSAHAAGSSAYQNPDLLSNAAAAQSKSSSVIATERSTAQAAAQAAANTKIRNTDFTSGNVTLPSAPPDAPTGLNASCNASGDSVTLTWVAPAGATAYDVRANNSSNDSASCTYGWLCTPDSEWSIDAYPSNNITLAITPGGNYIWWVHSKNTGGTSNAASGSPFSCVAPGACDTSFPNNQLHACLFDGVAAPTTANSALQQYLETNIPSPVGSWAGFFQDWGTGVVANTSKSDDVSGVWRGTVNFLGGTYIFHTQSDDGVELVIDGSNKVIDHWDDHALESDDSAPTTLSAGAHTIQLRWHESGGQAAIGLSWTQQ